MKKIRIILFLVIISIIIYFVYKMYLYYTPPFYRQPYQMGQKSDDTIRIAYIGDSWAYLHKEHNCKIAQFLEDSLHRPVAVYSYGISGLTSKEIYECMYNNNDFRDFLMKYRYDYCYISAGINDTYRKMGVSYYQQSVNYMIQFLQYNHIYPIIQEIPDYDISISYDWQNRPIKLHRRISMIVNNVPLDSKQVFRDALDEMIRENGYQHKVRVLRYKSWNNDYINDLNHLFLIDRLHLNEQGYNKLDSVIAIEIISSMTE